MSKQGEHDMFECLIYLISKTLHHHGILEATLEGERWNIVDHCFGTLRVPYLSLIFLLRYIVSSPLFLVIYGSELKVSSTLTALLLCLMKMMIISYLNGLCHIMMMWYPNMMFQFLLLTFMILLQIINFLTPKSTIHPPRKQIKLQLLPQLVLLHPLRLSVPAVENDNLQRKRS